MPSVLYSTMDGTTAPTSIRTVPAVAEGGVGRPVGIEPQDAEVAAEFARDDEAAVRHR